MLLIENRYILFVYVIIIKKKTFRSSRFKSFITHPLVTESGNVGHEFFLWSPAGRPIETQWRQTKWQENCFSETQNTARGTSGLKRKKATRCKDVAVEDKLMRVQKQVNSLPALCAGLIQSFITITTNRKDIFTFHLQKRMQILSDYFICLFCCPIFDYSVWLTSP